MLHVDVNLVKSIFLNVSLGTNSAFMSTTFCILQHPLSLINRLQQLACSYQQIAITGQWG